MSKSGLRTVFKEALCRRGIPEKVYTDNGKIYRSGQLQFVCASLGIALIHAKPYDPAAKGKIERFNAEFRIMRSSHLRVKMGTHVMLPFPSGLMI